MRWIVLWVLAGCGRLGFEPHVDAGMQWDGWTSMYAGTWTIEGSSAHVVNDSSVGGYFIAPFTRSPPVTLTMTFRIHALEPLLTDYGDHNIGTMDGLDVDTRDGQRCGWGDIGANMYVAGVDHMAGTDNDPPNSTFNPFPDGIVLESEYTSTIVHDVTSTCAVGVAGGTGDVVAMHAPYAGAGAVAIRVRGLDVSIDSLTLGP